MAKEFLTDSALETLRISANVTRQITDQSGMAVFVLKGAKGISISFRARKMIDGKSHTIIIGRYPRMKIAEARARYFQIVARLQRGEGLVSRRSTEDTVGVLWAEWRDEADKSLKTGTVKNNQGIYKNYISKIATKPVGEITASWALEWIKSQSESAVVRRKIAGHLRGVMRLAVVKNYISANPLSDISYFLPKIRITHLRSFSDLEMDQQMRQMFRDLRDMSPDNKCLFLMHFYTLLRDAEVRNIRFSHIYNQVLVTKTKTLDEFRLPLTRQAQRIAEYMRGRTEGDCMFPSRENSDRPIRRDELIGNLVKAGWWEKLCLHGIRTLGRQWLETLPGVKESLIELCLSHMVGGMVQRAYNRGEYIEQRREIMQKWCDYVDDCAGVDFTFFLYGDKKQNK